MIVVRRLTGKDATRYRDLRLEALETEPTAFASDHHSESARAEAEWAAQLERTTSFGAFDDDRLIGTATLLVEARQKSRHRAHVVAVYVRPQARGGGIGRMLLQEVIATARGQVLQLQLAVTVGNGTARRLYESLGFEIYGTEPRSLFVDGLYHDEHLMVLRLDAGQPESDKDE